MEYIEYLEGEESVILPNEIYDIWKDERISSEKLQVSFRNFITCVKRDEKFPGSFEFEGGWIPEYLIRADYFEDWIREEFYEMILGEFGQIVADSLVIDWAKTAENFESLYATVVIGKTTFYYLVKDYLL
ncbi:hypothetical protein LJC19_04930 [Oxalobacter sp. OttesenSCG-928-P03]|nr:hypothetical protein [Oxalobacter sp. OttesenSCG-928-P03]